MSQIAENKRRIEELEERIKELERIIDRELDVNLLPGPIEVQYLDCERCGEEFPVNIENGVVCPECGYGHNSGQFHEESET